MRKMLAMFAVLALCACTMGTNYDSNVTSKLVPGVTTETDAIGMLGAPNREKVDADGNHTMQWFYVVGTPIGGASKSVALMFGPDHKFIRVVSQSHT